MISIQLQHQTSAQSNELAPNTLLNLIFVTFIIFINSLSSISQFNSLSTLQAAQKSSENFTVEKVDFKTESFRYCNVAALEWSVGAKYHHTLLGKEWQIKVMKKKVGMKDNRRKIRNISKTGVRIQSFRWWQITLHQCHIEYCATVSIYSPILLAIVTWSEIHDRIALG